MTKIVLITGGSRGLGRSMALHAAAAGHDVIITFRAEEAAAAAVVRDVEAKGRRAAALPLDVSDVKAFPAFRTALVATLAKSFGAERLDALVNNAGVGLSKPFAETTEADFDRMFNVHLKSVYFLTQSLLAVLADGGRILNISSGLARFSLPGSSAYGTMKGGVETLTRYLAKELGPRKIAVNVIAPGAIETDFNGGAVRDNKQYNAFVASNTALGRAGLPDDVGGAVAALLGDGASWITGQRIEVSGGMFL